MPCQYYHFYKKGMTRAMVGLQGLHSSDTIRHSNISSSVRLKYFAPEASSWEATWKIATHLREVYYQLTITCNLYNSLTSMSVQSILEHCSGCKVKHAKECKEEEGHKAKSHPRRNWCESRKKLPKVSLDGTDESCRVERYLTPSIQFCWWTWVDSPLRSS